MVRPKMTQVRHGTTQNYSSSTWYDPKLLKFDMVHSKMTQVRHGTTTNYSSWTWYEPRCFKFDIVRPRMTQVRHGTTQNNSSSTWYDPKLLKFDMLNIILTLFLHHLDITWISFGHHSLNNVYVERSSILLLKDRHVVIQIQNRWPEKVDSQSVDSQSRLPQVCGSSRSKIAGPRE